MSDAPISEAQVLSLLERVRYPGFAHDIVRLGMVAGVTIDDRQVRIGLRLPGGKAVPLELERNIVQQLASAGVDVTVSSENPRTAVAGTDARHSAPSSPPLRGTPPEPATLPGVRAIIAVSSAKGGVGKSTVATNLACAFAHAGLKTGLLDADVYGPSLPIMMGTEAKPTGAGGNRFHPVEQYGVRCISMGFFLDESSPVIWRGPMVTGLLRQFVNDVVWGELDVLVIDLPPGTGDAQLTLVQHVRMSGAVIVTTPQAVALSDVVRGVAMFKQVQVPFLGVIENMSSFVCPECGEVESVFGEGGGAEVARLAEAPLLAQLPLDPRLSAEGDAGRPIVLAAPDSSAARMFTDVAARLAAMLGLGSGAPVMARA